MRWRHGVRIKGTGQDPRRKGKDSFLENYESEDKDTGNKNEKLVSILHRDTL